MPEKYSFRIPGVSDESWPIREDNPGGCENYGWGATCPTPVIINIIGFREKLNPFQQGFIPSPALPENLVQPGQSLGVDNQRYRDMRFGITYPLSEENQMTVRLSWRDSARKTGSLKTPTGQEITPVSSGEGLSTFEFINGEIYHVQFN